MIKIKQFQDRLASGRILKHGQNNNGMRWAEIHTKQDVVSAITRKTDADIARWLKEQGDVIISPAQQ